MKYATPGTKIMGVNKKTHATMSKQEHAAFKKTVAAKAKKK